MKCFRLRGRKGNWMSKGDTHFLVRVLRLWTFRRSAFRAEPSGTKALIPLPGFHSRDPDEAHLCSRRSRRRRAELAGRSPQETSGRHDHASSSQRCCSWVSPIRLNTGRDRRASLHRLLIETSLFSAFGEESPGADRNEDTVIVLDAARRQATARDSHPTSIILLVSASPSCQNQRL